MKIDRDLILKVAKNTRLNLSEKETQGFVKDFQDILDNFSKIKEIDTEKVQLKIHPVEIEANLREDKVEESLTQKEALKNTKNKKEGYFLGPKAI